MFKEEENKAGMGSSVRQLAQDIGEDNSLKGAVSKNLKSILEGNTVIAKSVGGVLIFGGRNRGAMLAVTNTHVDGHEKEIITMAVAIDTSRTSPVLIDEDLVKEMAKLIREDKKMLEKLPESIRNSGDDQLIIKELINADPMAFGGTRKFKKYSAIFKALSENEIAISQITSVRKQDSYILDNIRSEAMVPRVLHLELKFPPKAAVVMQHILDPRVRSAIFTKYGMTEEAEVAATRPSFKKQKLEQKFFAFTEKWSGIDKPELHKDDLAKDMADLASSGMDKEKVLHYLKWYIEKRSIELKEIEEKMKKDAATIDEMPDDDLRKPLSELDLKNDRNWLNDQTKLLFNIQKMTVLLEAV
jgi:hypothetical protein